jgi:MFS family permease
MLSFLLALPLARRLGLSLGVTQTLAWATTYYVPATMAGVAADDLGVSRTALIGGFSWSLIVAAICAPRIGRYIDRAGGRPILCAGAVITCAGLLLLAAANGLVWWYGAWSVLGVGMAMGLYDTSYSTIGRLLGAGARPAILGVTLMAGFAGTIGWPLGTWLAGAYGWRVACGLFAALQVVVILPILLVFIPKAGPPLPPAPPRASTGQAAAPDFAFVLLAIFFTSRAAISAIISVHLLVLLGGIGLATGSALLVAAMVGPAQVGARLLDWKFARELSPVTSARLGALLMPLGMLAVLTGAPALIFSLCYGMSNGILTINKGTLPMHLFGAQGYATRLGRLALPALIAQAAAPTLLAPLVDTVPSLWIFAGMGAVGVGALACLLPMRR